MSMACMQEEIGTVGDQGVTHRSNRSTFVKIRMQVGCKLQPTIAKVIKSSHEYWDLFCKRKEDSDAKI